MMSEIKCRASIHENSPNISPRAKSVHKEESSDEIQEESLGEIQEEMCTDPGSDFDGSTSDKNKLDISHSPPMTPQSQKLKPNNSSHLNYTPESQKPELENSAGSMLYWCIPFVVVLFTIFCFYGISPSVKTCSFENLQKLFPKQEPKLWKTLKGGIELVINKCPEKPQVYLFIHHGSDVFHLIRSIAIHTSECFGKNMIHIEMENNDFITTPSGDDDFGHVIEKYKEKIKKGNVILIANLNEIPAKAARALHFICDTYSPIANDVVIFLSLTVPPNKEGGANVIAEDTLYELWEQELKNFELEPLITRVTEEVLFLKS